MENTRNAHHHLQKNTTKQKGQQRSIAKKAQIRENVTGAVTSHAQLNALPTEFGINTVEAASQADLEIAKWDISVSANVGLSHFSFSQSSSGKMQSPVDANGGRNESSCVAVARETNLLTNFAAAIILNPPEVPNQLLRSTSAVHSRVKVIVSVSSINFEMNSFLSIDETGKHVTVYDFAQDQSIPVKSFTFDKVLLQSAMLNEVCYASATDILRLAVNGSDGCIFTYGHSRLGKTYSMLGSCDGKGSLGIIPRSIFWLYKLTEDMNAKNGSRFSIVVSAAQVIDQTDELVDLLKDQFISESFEDSKSSSHQSNSLKCSMQNLTQLEASSAEHLASYLDLALSKANIFKFYGEFTSHFIFTIKIYQHRKVVTDGLVEDKKSYLHFVDLESCSTTSEGSSSSSFSMSAVGDVIIAMLTGQQHVPHIHRKLTQVLRCLNLQQCYVSMVAQVSSASRLYRQTIRVLEICAKIWKYNKAKKKLQLSAQCQTTGCNRWSRKISSPPLKLNGGIPIGASGNKTNRTRTKGSLSDTECYTTVRENSSCNSFAGTFLGINNSVYDQTRMDAKESKVPIKNVNRNVGTMYAESQRKSQMNCERLNRSRDRRVPKHYSNTDYVNEDSSPHCYNVYHAISALPFCEKCVNMYRYDKKMTTTPSRLCANCRINGRFSCHSANKPNFKSFGSNFSRTCKSDQSQSMNETFPHHYYYHHIPSHFPESQWHSSCNSTRILIDTSSMATQPFVFMTPFYRGNMNRNMRVTHLHGNEHKCLTGMENTGRTIIPEKFSCYHGQSELQHLLHPEKQTNNTYQQKHLNHEDLSQDPAPLPASSDTYVAPSNSIPYSMKQKAFSNIATNNYNAVAADSSGLNYGRSFVRTLAPQNSAKRPKSIMTSSRLLGAGGNFTPEAILQSHNPSDGHNDVQLSVLSGRKVHDRTATWVKAVQSYRHLDQQPYLEHDEEEYDANNACNQPYAYHSQLSYSYMVSPEIPGNDQPSPSAFTTLAGSISDDSVFTSREDFNQEHSLDNEMEKLDNRLLCRIDELLAAASINEKNYYQHQTVCQASAFEELLEKQLDSLYDSDLIVAEEDDYRMKVDSPQLVQSIHHSKSKILELNSMHETFAESSELVQKTSKHGPNERSSSSENFYLDSRTNSDKISFHHNLSRSSLDLRSMNVRYSGSSASVCENESVDCSLRHNRNDFNLINHIPLTQCNEGKKMPENSICEIVSNLKSQSDMFHERMSTQMHPIVTDNSKGIKSLRRFNSSVILHKIPTVEDIKPEDSQVNGTKRNCRKNEARSPLDIKLLKGLIPTSVSGRRSSLGNMPSQFSDPIAQLSVNSGNKSLTHSNGTCEAFTFEETTSIKKVENLTNYRQSSKNAAHNGFTEVLSKGKDEPDLRQRCSQELLISSLAVDTICAHESRTQAMQVTKLCLQSKELLNKSRKYNVASLNDKNFERKFQTKEVKESLNPINIATYEVEKVKRMERWSKIRIQNSFENEKDKLHELLTKRDALRKQLNKTRIVCPTNNEFSEDRSRSGIPSLEDVKKEIKLLETRLNCGSHVMIVTCFDALSNRSNLLNSTDCDC